MTLVDHGGGMADMVSDAHVTRRLPVQAGEATVVKRVHKAAGEAHVTRRIRKSADALTEKRVRHVAFLKKTIDSAKHLVIGVVLIPDTVDLQGDRVPIDVIEDAAIDFGTRLNAAPIGVTKDMTDVKVGDVVASGVGVMHEDFSRQDVLRVAFNWVTPVEIPAGVYSEDAVPEGAWLVAIKVWDDEVWQDIEDDVLTGLSMGGVSKATRTDDGNKIAAFAEENDIPYYHAATRAVAQAGETDETSGIVSSLAEAA